MRNYLLANPGAPLIVAFMVLLLSAAALLALARTSEANNVADYAFYSLVLGIAIQIGVAVREERKHSHRHDDNPSDPS